MTVQDAWEIEQPHLMPVPGMFDGYVEVIARVSSTCLVTGNVFAIRCRVAEPIVISLSDCIWSGGICMPMRA
jgi:hypothetical protein